MRTPLVSVLIPAYNCAPYIEAAVQSVLEQDYPALEVIVIDDGSTDDTYARLQRFAGRIVLLRQANAGPAAARNRALAVAKGEYIAFLDGDDLWLPGKLRAQMAYFDRHPDLSMVYGRWTRWYAERDGMFPEAAGFIDEGESGAIDSADSGWIYCDMLLDSMIHSIAAAVHRRVFDAVGRFDESLRTGEDYDFWLRATQRFRIAKLSRQLALYRIHSTSATTVERKENNEYRVLVRALERFGKSGADGRRVAGDALNRRLATLCFNHGYRHYKRGNACVAAESFALALRYFDFRPKTLWYFVAARLRCATHRTSGSLMGGVRES